MLERAGRHAPRRRELHLARRLEDRRGRRRRDEPTAPRRRRRGRRGRAPGEGPAHGLHGQPERGGRRGPHRSARRPRERGRAHHPDPRAPQARTTRSSSATPASARRPSSRGSRGRSSEGEVPKAARGRDRLLARHGRAARRHALPRRLRGAHQGGHQGAREAADGAILFIDEIHTIVGAGATSGGTHGRVEPAQARARLRAAALHRRRPRSRSTARHFERDRALARRFQRIEVDEPSVEETIADPRRASQTQYEEFHGVTYTAEALEAAAKLAATLPPRPAAARQGDRSLDEAGAAAQPRARRRLRGRPCADIEQRASRKMAQIPPREVSTADKEQLRDLERDAARRRLRPGRGDRRSSPRRSSCRAPGLRAPEKPIGSFLFTGPTGVGKTELAKQLAKALGHRLPALRHERVHGAAHGLAPHRRAARLRRLRSGGLLTDAIAKTPHAVLLLDEIEKAHPDVFNVLLQVMDHGTLTDNNGKKTDFRHVVLHHDQQRRRARSRRRRASASASAATRATTTASLQAHVQPRVPQPARRAHRVQRRSTRRSWAASSTSSSRELGAQLAEQAT